MRTLLRWWRLRGTETWVLRIGPLGSSWRQVRRQINELRATVFGASLTALIGLLLLALGASS